MVRARCKTPISLNQRVVRNGGQGVGIRWVSERRAQWVP